MKREKTSSGLWKVDGLASARHRRCVWVMFLAYLAGSFSAARVWPAAAGLREAGLAGCWLTLALWAMVAGVKPGRTAAEGFGSVQAWVQVVVGLHLYIALSTFWATSQERNWSRTWSVALLAVLLQLTFLVGRGNPGKTAEAVFRLFFWVSLLYCGAGLAGVNENGRMAIWYGGPNVFVRIISCGIFAAVYLCVRTGSMRWLLPAPALLVCAVMSGSRGGMLSLAVSAPLLIFVVRGAQRARLMAGLTLAGCCGLAVVIRYPSAIQPVRDYWSGRFSIYLSGDSKPNRLDYGGRDQMFASAYDAFRQRPLFGNGLIDIQTPRADAAPHNLVLAVARDGGVVGLALLVVALLQMVGRYHRRKSLEHRMALATGCFFFCAAMFSGSYYDTRYAWLFFLLYMLPARRVSLPAGRFVRQRRESWFRGREMRAA